MKIKSYSKKNLFLLVSKQKKSTLHKIKTLFLLNKALYDALDINKPTQSEKNYHIHNTKITITTCTVKRILKKQFLGIKWRLNHTRKLIYFY